ncbi:MAG TPA: mandelate racemase/muconate lactonizing enzyme family protein [Chloroflexota bacterium]
MSDSTVRIVGVEARLYAIPTPRPMVNAQRAATVAHHVFATVRTNQGISGTGYAFTWDAGLSRAIAALVAALGQRLDGADPFLAGQIWRDLWGAVAFVGHQGMSVLAIAALDTALWDLRGKLLDTPVYRLLGGTRQEVPCYASGWLGLHLTQEELERVASALVEGGFRAVKMNVGRDPDEDVARVRAVRRAVGDGVALLVDANHAWRPAEAVRIGRRLEEIGIFWLEDPVHQDDLDGYAQVAAALDVPVAAGETAYTKLGIRALLERSAADVLMPDLQRAGGITEWMKIAALAEAWHRPVSSHVFLEPSVHLVAAATNALFLEFMARWDHVLEEPLRVREGTVRVPEAPGLGICFRESALEQYRTG